MLRKAVRMTAWTTIGVMPAAIIVSPVRSAQWLGRRAGRLHW